MSQAVMIKGNKSGFVLWLNPELEYEELYQKLMEKFEESADFFRFSKPIAVEFQGYSLNEEQVAEMVDGIMRVTALQISYIIEGDSVMETKLQKFLDERREEERLLEEARALELEKQTKQEDGMFYRGTLRSGQSISSETSVVVMGDVNPGATVSSNGNIVVLGTLKGYAYAGMAGDEKAFVVALQMQPMQIRIGNRIARNSDEEVTKGFFKKKKKKTEIAEPQMAFVEEGRIYMEPISKSLIHELMM